MRYIRLFAVFFRTSVQTDMEYRADFFTRIFASLLGLVTTIGMIAVTYAYTDNIKGWTFAQTLGLISVYYLMQGLIETFIAPNMRQIMGQVREGGLDFVLLKPVSSQFLATFRQVNIWQGANILIGLGMIAYSASKFAVSVGAAQALAFFVTLGSGAVIIYSFWLCLVTLCFWFTRLDNIEQIIWQAFAAGRYPIEIYPSWLRNGLTYVVPVAFIIGVPAQALAGKTDLGYIGVSVLAGALSLFVASAFWRFGLKNYTGASS